MAKRKESWDCMKEIKKNRLDNVRKFWERHYRKAEQNEAYVTCLAVFQFFTKENPTSGLDMSEFVRQSQVLGIGSKKCRKKSVFLSRPISHSSELFHGVNSPVTSSDRNEERGGAAQLHLINIQGLITNAKNKGEYLNLVTNNNPKIVVMTETHLNKKKLHDNAEVKLGFPEFNLHRCDRDTEYDIDDEYQLSSHGGCLVLTSPSVVSTKKMSFSNGNCELLIVEVPQMESHIITIYKPPPPNYSLRKFQEILAKVRHFLTEREKSDYKVIMLGDFNFPSHVVDWIRSEE